MRGRKRGRERGEGYLQQVEPSGSTRTNTFRPSPISRASLALGSMKLATLGGSLLKTAGRGKVAER